MVSTTGAILGERDKPVLLYTVHSDLPITRNNNRTIKMSYNEGTFDICDSVKTCMDSVLVNCTMDI
jgi:hypothetical protein